MSALDSLSLVGQLSALLAILQSAEFFLHRAVTADNGVWQWQDLENDFAHPKSSQKLFSLVLGHQNFHWLNILRLSLALLYIAQPNAASVIGLLGIHLLTLLRWRGTYNGGSDYMCLMLLVMLSLGHLGSGPLVTGVLWYISIQLSLSYFKAGWVKLKNPLWRNGVALNEFLDSQHYEKSTFIDQVLKRKTWLPILGWGVIVFELAFPLSLISPQIALGFMSLGILFHFGNVYFFGLNRFFWAWLAAYPALYYCSSL